MCPFELSSELSTGSSAQVLCVDLDGWMGGGEGGGPKGEGMLRTDSLHCKAETVTVSRLTQFTTGQANESKRGSVEARNRF